MRSPIAVLTHCLAFSSALNVVGWFSLAVPWSGRFRFSSAIAWDAIFLTGSVTSIRSLASALVLGPTPVMRETDLKLCKVNQHPIPILSRHLLTWWLSLRLRFCLEWLFGLLLARFFGRFSFHIFFFSRSFLLLSLFSKFVSCKEITLTNWFSF